MAEPDETTRRRAITLFERGLALLDGGRSLAAWRAGRRLMRYRYSGAYELRGRALAAMGRLSQGRAVLERGVRRVPGAWMMWFQLGILRSDAGDYQGAFQAFDTTATLDGDPDLAYLMLNTAVVHWRLDQPREALSLLDQIEPAELAEREGLATQVAALRSDLEGALRAPTSPWRKLFPRLWR